MTANIQMFADVSDRDLLVVVHRLATDERRATARLIASLAELDARRLYLAEGYSSLFTYCTQVLHLSEHAAYVRIEAAGFAPKSPVFLEKASKKPFRTEREGRLAGTGKSTPRPVCPLDCRESDGRGRHADT